MNDRQLDYFRKLLTGEINRLVLNRTVNEYHMQDYPEALPDIIDQAINEGQRSFHFRMRDRERLLSRKIKDALRRIEEGTFGICEQCGENIPIARLKARPVTNYCLSCKIGMEAQERILENGRMGFLEMR